MKKLKFILMLLVGFSTTAAFALEVGSQTPVCDATFLKNGEPFTLEQYKGKVVFVDFWATWCPPCKKSMPFLNQMRKELADKGFEVVAINVDENSDDAKSFLKKHPVNYVIVMDPDGNCPTAYNVMAMPSSYFVDRQGVVRRIHLGFRSSDEAEIRQEIISLLNENVAKQ